MYFCVPYAQSNSYLLCFTIWSNPIILRVTICAMEVGSESYPFKKMKPKKFNFHILDTQIEREKDQLSFFVLVIAAIIE